ncbi:hypothetical protein [Desulfobacter latus]|uniref:DUF4384 domain-containing protein n=1 Tax=Desulfobacter latus TaxID=2292 RepID=A0A850SPR2_9BACT|nr:hypothetical protein [Desulfobacter latus]NWH03464.1 hypothetical protein [Desulfobacter latus]
MNVSCKISTILMASFILTAVGFTHSLSEERRVRAKIGIQIKSDDNIKRAKSMDRVRTSDFLRIYVLPEEPFHVYVVHTDYTTATLLNTAKDNSPKVTHLTIPSRKDFYQVDGKSPIEGFSIVCSPDELIEMSELFGSGSISHHKWAAYETALRQKSKIDLSQRIEKPFAIAGNVRGNKSFAGNDRGNKSDTDVFIQALPIFSGNHILVRTYEFRVKK